MAENLDTEAVKQFNETMRDLNSVMPSVITALGQLSGVSTGAIGAKDALDKYNKSLKEGTFLIGLLRTSLNCSVV